MNIMKKESIHVPLFHGHDLRIAGIFAGNPPVAGGLLEQKPVMQSVDVFFMVSLNKLLNKQYGCRWFETAWRLCDLSCKYNMNCVPCVSIGSDPPGISLRRGPYILCGILLLGDWCRELVVIVMNLI